MFHRILPSLLLIPGLLAIAVGQDAGKQGKKPGFISGPQAGSLLPGPCEVYNVNGSTKGRYHCLVCEYGFDPVVMVFAPEPKGDDGAISALLEKLDGAIERNQESTLRAFVVFLSPDCRRSPVDNEEDTEKLIEEEMARASLFKRLETRAAKVKAVVVACTTAEAVKSYKINPKAQATVIFYKKLRVIDNFAFEKGTMTENDAGMIVDNVDKWLKDALKRPIKRRRESVNTHGFDLRKVWKTGGKG